MATSMRSVPLTYRELVSAIQAGVYPWERTWIDFKRRLYPEGDDAADGAAREKVSQELARDMASMAELGGFLVYGVKEDKAKHTFTVDEMSLPVGLHETVDAVARDRITPPPTVVPTPADSGQPSLTTASTATLPSWLVTAVTALVAWRADQAVLRQTTTSERPRATAAGHDGSSPGAMAPMSKAGLPVWWFRHHRARPRSPTRGAAIRREPGLARCLAWVGSCSA